MKIKVLFVCHGNICRSPMAEFILKDMVEKRGIKDEFHIESRATSTEEIWGGKGNPIYLPAQKELRRNNIGNTTYTNFSNKRAKQVTKQDYKDYYKRFGKNRKRPFPRLFHFVSLHDGVSMARSGISA